MRQLLCTLQDTDNLELQTNYIHIPLWHIHWDRIIVIMISVDVPDEENLLY